MFIDLCFKFANRRNKITPKRQKEITAEYLEEHCGDAKKMEYLTMVAQAVLDDWEVTEIYHNFLRTRRSGNSL